VFQVDDLEAARWALEHRGASFDPHVGEVARYARFATFRDQTGTPSRSSDTRPLHAHGVAIPWSARDGCKAFGELELIGAGLDRRMGGCKLGADGAVSRDRFGLSLPRPIR